MFFNTFLFAALAILAVRQIHVVKLFFCVHASPIACAACLAVHPWCLSLSFSSMMSFFAHCCKLATVTCLVSVFCGVFWARIFHSDHSANTHSQDLPAWDGYSKVFVSHKTAPDGPQTGVHDPASHSCLFHASLISSSHFLRPRYEDWKPPKTHTIIETEKPRLKDPTTVTAEFFFIMPELVNRILKYFVAVGSSHLCLCLKLTYTYSQTLYCA